MGTRETTVKLTVADNFSAQLRSFAQALDAAEGHTRQMGASLHQAQMRAGALRDLSSSLSPVLLGVGAAGVAAGAGLFKMGAAYEQTEVAFAHMLGSGEQAKAFLDDLRDFAARTPFNFIELSDATKRMMAFGFAAEDVIPMLTDVGDAVSGLGAGQEGINRVIRALGQMQTAGKLNARDMMQLTEVGIPAWQYLADAIGVTKAEVMKLSEQGLIPADQAIQAILAGMREDFGGLMAEQAKTAAGQLSNLRDKAEAVAVEFGTSLLPAAKDLIGVLDRGVTAFGDLDQATKLSLIDLGAWTAGAGLLGGGALMAASNIAQVAMALKALGVTRAALGGLLGTPLGALAIPAVLGIGAAIAANGQYQNELEATIVKFREQEAELRKGSHTYDEYRGRVEALAREHGLLVDSQGRLAHATREGVRALEEEASTLTEAGFAAAKFSPMIDEAARAWARMGAGVQEATTATEMHARSYGETVTFIAQVNGRMRDSMDLARAAQMALALGIGTDLVSGLLGAGMASDALSLGLGAVDALFGTSAASAFEMNLRVAAAIDEFKRTGDLEAFRLALLGIYADFSGVTRAADEAAEAVKRFKRAADSIPSYDVKTIEFVLRYGTGGQKAEMADAFAPPISTVSSTLNPAGAALQPAIKPSLVAPIITNTRARALGGPFGPNSYLYNEDPFTRPEVVVSGDRGGYVLTKQDAQAALAMAAPAQTGGLDDEMRGLMREFIDAARRMRPVVLQPVIQHASDENAFLDSLQRLLS